MGDRWPLVGLEADSLPAHASNIRSDIEKIQARLQQREEAIPIEVYGRLARSVLNLVQKVVDQPSMKDIMNTITRIDENTKLLVKNSSPVKAQDPNLQSREPVEAQPKPEPELEKELSLEDEARELGMQESFISRIKDMNQTSVRALLDATRRGKVILASRGQLPATGTATINTRRLAGLNATAGSPSKIILSSAQDNIHEKIYQPLSKDKREIRIVRLSPSVDAEYDISCEFSVVSLDSDPDYNALSYTWGDPKDTLPIKLNGHRFDVTRNLKGALQRLRTIGTDKPIWVDAICINQTDMDERMHQVQLMRYIFEGPKEVIVYLGEPQATLQTRAQQMKNDQTWDANLYSWKGDETDIPRVNEILKYAQKYADTFPDSPDERTSNPLMLVMCFIRLLAGDVHLSDIGILGNINIQKVCIMAFESLTMQPWFFRIWVVQETILPSSVTVVYGRFSAPLQMYADAARFLEQHRSTCCNEVLPSDKWPFTCLSNFSKQMLTIAQSANLWTNNEKISLMTLLRLYYPRDATDPRDKIFGLLGLVRDWGNQTPITPNYSISARTLYEEAAIVSIYTTNSLEVLTFRADIPRLKQAMLEFHRQFKSSMSYYRGISDEAIRLEQTHNNQAMLKTKPEPLDLPYTTWAPDWGQINDRTFQRSVAQRINRALVFNACGGQQALAPKRLFTNDPIITRTAVLPVSGLRIGKASLGDRGKRGGFMPFLVTEGATLNTDRLAAVNNFPLDVQPKESELKPYVTGGITKYDAICRAICGDTFFNEKASSVGYGTEPMFRRLTTADVESVKVWRKWMFKYKHSHQGRKPPSPADFETTSDFQGALAVDRAVRSVGLFRRYFELDSGYIGMTMDVVDDDEAYILAGARTPFMLRLLGELEIEGLGKKPVYINLGEIYLAGGMDGELVEESKKSGKGFEDVYII